MNYTMKKNFEMSQIEPSLIYECFDQFFEIKFFELIFFDKDSLIYEQSKKFFNQEISGMHINIRWNLCILHF